MGIRHRRSVNLGGGVKLNLNTKSASVTAGGKAGRFTAGTSGRTTVSTSLPGTGLYYSKSSGGGSGRKSSKPSDTYSADIDEDDEDALVEDLTAGVEPISAIFDNKTLQSMNGAAFDLYYKGFLAYTKSLTPADMANVDADGIMDQLRRNREELARRAHAGAQVTASGQKQIRPADYSKWKSGAGLVCFWVLLLLALCLCAFAVWGAYAGALPVLGFLLAWGAAAVLLIGWYKLACGMELI